MVCSVNNNSYGTWSLWKRESGILEICHPGSQWFQMLFVKTHWLSFIFSLFGDEAETVFWEVALHYLRREKSRILCLKHQVTYSRTGYSILPLEMKTVRLKFFTTMLMLLLLLLLFFFAFSIDTIEKRFMALIDCICVKNMTRLNPSALTVWPEKLRGWKKKHSSYFGPHKDCQICWNLLSSC